MEPSELLGPARLLPQAVLSKKFRTVRWGGLDATDVDAFMGRVAGELDLLTDERNEMAAEIGRLRAALDDQERPADAPSRIEIQAVSILRNAQERADQLLEDASTRAQRIVGDGQRRREELMFDGRRKAEAVIKEAVEEAGRLAARITAEAPIEGQRQAAYMLSFAQSLRAGLEGYLASLRGSLDEWDRQERERFRELHPDEQSA
jgi:DivIVA domain-containing protein